MTLVRGRPGRQPFGALVRAISLLRDAGVTTYHVYQVRGPREMGNQPMTEWRTRTLHALAWGGIRQDLPIDDCCLGNGTRTNIEEVRIWSNAGTILATVLSLGFWQPLKVSWRCARPPGLRGVVAPEPPAPPAAPARPA